MALYGTEEIHNVFAIKTVLDQFTGGFGLFMGFADSK